MSAGWVGVFPRVWTWVPAAAGTLAAAWSMAQALAALKTEGSVRRRAHLLCGVPAERRPGGAGPGPRGRRTGTGKRFTAGLRTRRAREGAASTGAGVLGLLLIGGAAGWLVGGAAAWGTWRLLRRRAAAQDPRSSTERTEEEQLPLVAELIAACLAAGAGPGRAAEAVGSSVGGPLGTRLVRAAVELRLGAEPALVWGRFAERPWGVEFARCMERAGAAGVPAVESVARLAAELRGGRARAAGSRARRAAVLVTGPLGLCFLPAFLVVGVVPVLLGLARSLW
nr:type II secretion system F family protein [Streptomyces qinglanensis]